MTEHVVVLCTVPDEDTAVDIARAVVRRRLAACANIVGGVRSIYRWKDKIEDGQERLLILKTRHDQFEALRDAVVEMHPYEAPELLALPVLAGNPAYLSWIDQSV